MSKITDVGAALDPQFERVDTPRTNDYAHNIGNDLDGHYVVDIDFARQLERELAKAQAEITRLKSEAESWEKVFDRTCEHLADAKTQIAEAVAQRDKARSEADAMDEFIGAAAKREKEASAIIKSLTADINITVPIRDYAEMSPKDCYELGMMDGVAALKSQINAAIDAAIDAAMKEGEK